MLKVERGPSTKRAALASSCAGIARARPDEYGARPSRKSKSARARRRRPGHHLRYARLRMHRTVRTATELKRGRTMLSMTNVSKVFRTDLIETHALREFSPRGESPGSSSPSPARRARARPRSSTSPACSRLRHRQLPARRRRRQRARRRRALAPAQREDRLHLPELQPDPRPRTCSTTSTCRCATAASRAPSATSASSNALERVGLARA